MVSYSLNLAKSDSISIHNNTFWRSLCSSSEFMNSLMHKLCQLISDFLSDIMSSYRREEFTELRMNTSSKGKHTLILRALYFGVMSDINAADHDELHVAQSVEVLKFPEGATCFTVHLLDQFAASVAESLLVPDGPV